LDITLRDPSDAAAWAARLEAEVLPTGSLRRPRAGQVSALPGYEAGAWWVQDAAAALPARMLAALSDLAGKRVLDLCAAPGGKTLHLAALGAQVTALDISGPRLQRLAENLARTGLQANPIAADALTWQPEGAFDAILLDAPCSATGTIRRHPDLPFLRSAADIEALTVLQATLIDRAAGWLKPGGVMVYATCSLLPAEGEAQIDAALARLPDLRAAPLPLPEGLPATVRAPHGALRLLPAIWAGRGGIDGFYIAGLQRA
jgi:16S rRNA (cytosine967-C5)-methyltransferase